MKSSRRTCAALIALLAALAVAAASAQQSQEKTGGSKVRVGTFDSRALAVVYYRSETFRRHMDGLRAQYVRAKAEKNRQRRRELEAESADPTWPDSGWPPSPAQQELIHKQGFSSWPVDNILERIKDSLPEIGEEAGVDVIVSAWDVVYQGPGVEFVDVTDFLLKPFATDEQTLSMVKEMKKHEPVPLEKLKHDHD